MYSYNNRYLMKDNKPILPIMGEFHFSRYPKEDWERELLKMKQGGVEIAATYVFWIHHEERQGEWDFTGNRCLRDFLNCCKNTDMKVWLRIGPWAHGECRNGGFPDWLVAMERDGKLKLRTDNEGYLSLVDTFYEKIAEQAQGMMDKDGGPVIGIQIENEYGHCGGPSDREEGMKHMRTLKRMAEEKGLITPYYSATGWGGAYVPEGFLAVLGGYVDAPWAEHTHELEASENFLFIPFHDDANIGSDLGGSKNRFTFEPDSVPYLTAELGGGLQVTGHRRTYPYPEDIEAQTICMLGAGANLIGYYMYHGGVNPDGKYSTLQESTATGYNNNLPEKSYDFQTCIRENGLPGESFYRLRKHHIFIKNVEELLADTVSYMPSNLTLPADPEDMETIRACLRYNAKADCGFLFINNHQRKRKMTAKRITPLNPLEFEVEQEHGGSADGKTPVKKVIRFDNIAVETDKCLILPYNLPVKLDGKEIRLVRTNACYLGFYGGQYCFYTDEKEPYFEWSDQKEHSASVRVLTTHEAEHVLLYKNQNNRNAGACGSSGGADCSGRFEIGRGIELSACGAVEWRAAEKENEYELVLEYGQMPNEQDQKAWDAESLWSGDVFLSLDFGGDMAQLYDGEKLIADWFSNGEVWQVAMRRYGFPKKLTLRLYPFNAQVYYDLPPKKECVLTKAQLWKMKA